MVTSDDSKHPMSYSCFRIAARPMRLRDFSLVAKRDGWHHSITSKPDSTLAKSSDIVLRIPENDEACFHKLAPTTSTTAMLAMGDALALVLSDERGFAASDFARFHPGGSSGQNSNWWMR